MLALVAWLLGASLLPGPWLPAGALTWAGDTAAEDAAEEAEKAAEDAAEEAAKAAEEAAEEAAQAAEDAAEEAAQAAEDAAEEAAKAAEDAAEQAAEDATDAAEEAAEDAADQAEDAAEEAADQAEDAAEDAAKEAEDAAEDAAEQAEDAADDAEDAADDADDADDALDDHDEDRSGSGSDDDRDGDDNASDDRGGDDDHHGGRPRAGKHERAESGGSRSADAEIAIGEDPEGNAISLGEWLVIASPAEVAALEDLGYVTREREALSGLDRVLVRMEAPASFDIQTAQATIRRAAPDAEADFNHLYRPEAVPDTAPAGSPRERFPQIGAESGEGIGIGIIDTAVDTDHPALRGVDARSRDFVPYSAERPSDHGTTVASILAGQGADCPGLLPRVRLYLASAFFRTPSGGDGATTASLVRALDWMAAEQVHIVNMSLAGPPNAILESAIARARALGTLVVAAVGNRGPASKPLYPAAYPDVVAVTAVGPGNAVYRLANRGEQVDFAAPGVNIRHAAVGGGWSASSGTSMAAPFAAAVIATSCRGPGPLAECVRALETRAEDIGAAGFDPVFGYGLIRPLRAGSPASG